MNKTKRVIAAAAGAVALMGLGAAAVGAPQPERAAAPEVVPEAAAPEVPLVVPEAPADWEGDSPVPGPEERAMMEPAWRQQETDALLAAQGIPGGFPDVYGSGAWEGESLVLYYAVTADPDRVAEFLAGVERARQGGGPHQLVVRPVQYSQQELDEWAERMALEPELRTALGLGDELFGVWPDCANGRVVLLFEGAAPSGLPKRIAGPGTPRLGVEGFQGRIEPQPGPDIG
jgi:hypothetical protein